MFTRPGDSSIIIHILKRLDMGSEFNDIPQTNKQKLIYSMVDTLKLILTSLPTPLIPDQVIEDGYHEYVAARKLVEKRVGVVEGNCFYYLVAFLREFLVGKGLGVVYSVDVMSGVFVEVLFGKAEEGSEMQRKKREFLRLFLGNHK